MAVLVWVELLYQLAVKGLHCGERLAVGELFHAVDQRAHVSLTELVSKEALLEGQLRRAVTHVRSCKRGSLLVNHLLHLSELYSSALRRTVVALAVGTVTAALHCQLRLGEHALLHLPIPLLSLGFFLDLALTHCNLVQARALDAREVSQLL